MQVKSELLSPTNRKLTITADQSEIDDAKQAALKDLSRSVKLQGFREGKAPAALVQKQIDPNLLQTEFLERAVNQLYLDAARREKLRPVTQPEISITKFVPFSDLEFTASVEAVGEIKL